MITKDMTVQTLGRVKRRGMIDFRCDRSSVAGADIVFRLLWQGQSRGLAKAVFVLRQRRQIRQN
jgi:hypothetical protein